MVKKFTHNYVKCIVFLSFLFNAKNTFSQASPHLQVVKNYVSAHQQQLGISQKDVESVALTYEYTDPGSGIQHIYSTQKLNGLTITESNFALHIAGATQTETNKLIAIGKYKTIPVNAAFSATLSAAALSAAVFVVFFAVAMYEIFFCCEKRYSPIAIAPAIIIFLFIFGKFKIFYWNNNNNT